MDPDARRDEILRAAVRAFATRPYAGVHVADVAREANASRALVNHYFGDKRGLFLAAVRDIVARTPSIVAGQRGLTVEQMVDANTSAWLDLVQSGREASMLFLGGIVPGHDPELDALQDELRDQLAERILRNHLGAGELPPAALLTMRAATGLMERAARDWIDGKGATRAQTHAIIANSILATVRHVLPAVLAAQDEQPEG